MVSLGSPRGGWDHPRALSLETRDNAEISRANRAEGKEYEIFITAEGKVLERMVEEKDDDCVQEEADDEKEEDEAEHELEIPLSAVPAKVKAAAEKAVKGIELSEAEVSAVLVYEVEGKANGREVEGEVTSTGKVIEIEREKDDDDDD